MKKFCFFLFIFLPVLTMLGQTGGNAVYIYRNDGGFNAFLRADVDSITYSTLDSDSVKHNDIVMQLVWTRDSLYRIPLSAIDSVTFTTPACIYKADVVPLTDAWLNYVSASDSVSVTFTTSLPAGWMPSEGQVLVAETRAKPFDNGFAGRVIRVEPTAGGTKLICSEVDITDIYEQLVCVGRSSSEPSGDSVSVDDVQGVLSPHLLHRVSLALSGAGTSVFNLPKFGFTVPFPGEILSGGSASFSIQPTVILDYVIYIRPGVRPVITMQGTETDECLAGMTLKADNMVKYEYETPHPLTITIPTSIPGLYGKIQLGTFFKGSFSGKLSYTQPFTYRQMFGFIYNGRQRGPVEYHRLTFGSSSAILNLNGSAYLGGFTRVSFDFLSENIAHAAASAYFGPKLSGTVSLTSGGAKDGTLYEALRDSKLKADLELSLELDYRLKIPFRENDTFGDGRMNKISSFSLSWPLDSWYIVPTFTVPLYQADVTQPGNAELETTVSRKLAMPVQVGLSMYDANDNLLATHYAEEDYRDGLTDGFSNPLNVGFSGLSSGVTYHCYPMVKILGYELRAVPSGEFRVEGSVMTGSASAVSSTGATLLGNVTGIPSSAGTVSVGVVYGTTASLPDQGIYIASGHITDGIFNVVVAGLSANTNYYYCSYLCIDGVYTYGEVRQFKTSDDSSTLDKAVDLGLSVKWASCNVGASLPEEYGGYYAWGETEEKSNYDWETYKYYNSTTISCVDIGADISGTPYDVAHLKWGGAWRMPTYNEQRELCQKCTWKSTTLNGVSGKIVTGPSGKSIFLPAAGYRSEGVVNNSGSIGGYWSGTLATDQNSADVLIFMDNSQGGGHNGRYSGLSVRPVQE